MRYAEQCIFGIPSYYRADAQRTVEYLRGLGVPKERVILSTQTEDDHVLYKDRWSDQVSEVLYREGHSAADNRNTIIQHVGEGRYLVLLDDDISSVMRLDGTKLAPVDTLDGLYDLIDLGYGQMESANTVLWGVYPVCNAFYMSTGLSTISILIGSFFAMKTNGELLDSTFKTKEDYELSCRTLRRYGSVIRLNDYTVKAQHYSKGGCESEWKDRQRVIDTASRLVGMYPDILMLNPTKEGEVKVRRDWSPARLSFF